MDRQPVLEGERLLLRPLREDDWEALYAVASDPKIWEVHPAHDRWKEDVFRARFAEGMASGGALVAIDKASGTIVGSSRFQLLGEGAGRVVEIGWTFLARSHWGGEVNRDMKRLMLDHAFKFVDRVDFRIGEDNVRSRRAIEKIGAVLCDRTEMTEMAGRQVRHVIYEITRDSYANGPLNPSGSASA